MRATIGRLAGIGNSSPFSIMRSPAFVVEANTAPHGMTALSNPMAQQRLKVMEMMSTTKLRCITPPRGL